MGCDDPVSVIASASEAISEALTRVLEIASGFALAMTAPGLFLPAL
jgi:hypothetical protein